MVAQRRVAVVGGGVSGLATAYHLLASGSSGGPSGDVGDVAVTVLEAQPRLGGKISTETVAGLSVDTGPDAVLVRSPAAAGLIEQLGLTADLRPPGGGGAYLWSRGRLRPLPAGSVFGVPDRLWPLLRSGLLRPAGFVRAGADLVLPRRIPAGDPTIEQVLRPRFGREVFERLIEPMLGGVHAGRAGRLSARSAVPEVMALAERERSLYLALRRRERPGGVALMTLDGGLSRLVRALAAPVSAAPGSQLLTGAAVAELTVVDGRYRLVGAGFDPVDADQVVLSTPAWEAARLLRPLAPAAAAALEAIPYAGVATVMLGYPRQAVPALRGTGFLVPPVEHRLLVGCTWLTSKWPHLSAQGRPAAASAAPGPDPAPVLLRCMVGRDGDQVWAGMDDAELVDALRLELAASMGVRAEPTAVHVRRMPAAMPQYVVGHADRLAAAARALTALPGLHLTGAGYRGVGIASCLAQARDTAAAVRAGATSPVGAR